MRFRTRRDNRTNSLALYGWRLMRNGRVFYMTALVLLMACGQNTGQATLMPSPSVAASASSSTAPPPSAKPTGSPTPTVAAFNLACRLPVVTPVGSAMVRGWVTFPGATFARDPATLPNPSPEHMPSYDRAIGAWVPVERNYVAPDGAHYVLPLSGPAVNAPIGHAMYIVDAKTGSRRLILSSAGPGSGRYWSGYADFEAEGIYLSALGGGSDAPQQVPGLWLLDPKTGAVRLVDGGRIWESIGGGFAWALDYPSVVGGTLFKVYRLDLATGQGTSWYESKTSLRPLSATSEGELLVGYGESGFAVLGASHRLTVLDSPAINDFGSILATPGVWIAITSGVALYVKDAGIKVMARSESGNVIFPAGGCS